jgi:hypothetical protein
MGLGSGIPDPRSKRPWIPDPDTQHCNKYNVYGLKADSM